jgi:hypothetical protein
VLVHSVRVVRPRPAASLASLVNALFPISESPETIRALCIGARTSAAQRSAPSPWRLWAAQPCPCMSSGAGAPSQPAGPLGARPAAAYPPPPPAPATVPPDPVHAAGVSAHQKLGLLCSLVRLMGYESLAVFGDCFDEVRTPPPRGTHAGGRGDGAEAAAATKKGERRKQAGAGPGPGVPALEGLAGPPAPLAPGPAPEPQGRGRGSHAERTHWGARRPPILPSAPQVVLLDPVQYPGAVKVFAREVCRNDLLNFGRQHFFFPDSRLALDLSTDKTLKARRGGMPSPAPRLASHAWTVPAHFCWPPAASHPAALPRLPCPACLASLVVCRRPGSTGTLCVTSPVAPRHCPASRSSL